MKRRNTIYSGMALVLGISLFLCCLVTGQTKSAPKLPKGGLDLNKATAEQIGKYPGLNSVLAKAIVEQRDKSGLFKKPEDLLNVKGMTKEILNKIKPKIDEDMLIVGPPPPSSDEDEDEPSLKPSKC